MTSTVAKNEQLTGICKNCGNGSFTLAMGKRKLAGQLLRCCKKCMQIENVDTGVLLKKGKEITEIIDENTVITVKKTEMTLNAAEQQMIKNSVAKRVFKISKGSSDKSQLFKELHREIKKKFQVTSYKDIHTNRVRTVLNFITEWKPAS